MEFTKCDFCHNLAEYKKPLPETVLVCTKCNHTRIEKISAADYLIDKLNLAMTGADLILIQASQNWPQVLFNLRLAVAVVAHKATADKSAFTSFPAKDILHVLNHDLFQLGSVASHLTDKL